MTGIAVAGLLALLYVGLIHRAAWQARKRRRLGQARHLAARIFPPRQTVPSGGEAGNLRWHLVGLFTDQPCGLPLAAAILVSGAVLVLALDPLLDDPILWGGVVPAGWRATLPDGLKVVWVGGALALAIGHVVWVFWQAPRLLSRHWLLLHPDGAISAKGAAFPRIDPTRPLRCQEGIHMPARRVDGLAIPEGWAEGAVMEQDGQTIGFVFNPYTPRPGAIRRFAETPGPWWRVELAPDHVSFRAFLAHHHPAGADARRRP